MARMMHSGPVDQGGGPDRAHARALIDALVDVSGDTDARLSLERIVETASALLEATYAVLVVTDDDGTLVDCVTTGVEPEQWESADSLSVEVRARGKLTGTLTVTGPHHGAFADDDERTLKGLAAAAGIVIDDGRARELGDARARWFEASLAITRSLVAHGLDTALRQVADLACEVSGANAACVGLLQTDELLEIRVVSGAPDWTPDSPPVTLPGSIAGAALAAARPLVLSEVGAHPAIPSLIRAIGRPASGPAAFLPLHTAEGPAGLLVLLWDTAAARSFQTFDLELATSFAEQAALALEVSRARNAGERRRLVEDRDRIARDLHDIVIQRLFAIGLQLDHASSTVADADVASLLSKAVDDIDVSIKDIRTSIFKLQNSETGSLRAGVHELVDEYAAVLGYAPTIAVRGPIDQAAAARDDVLAVLREALSNVARHAGASAAHVSVAVTDTHLSLVVSDDGHGIPLSRSESGLVNARIRAAARHGQLTLSSIEPRGTRFAWTVALD